MNNLTGHLNLSLLTGSGQQNSLKRDLYSMLARTLMASSLANYAPLYIACCVAFVFTLSFVLRKYDSGEAKKTR